ARGGAHVRAVTDGPKRHAPATRGDEPRYGVRIAVGAEHALHAKGTQQAHDAAAGGSEADLPDGALAQVDTRAARGVDEGGERDHRSAVLVVVQHRLLQARLQQSFDFKTLGCGEVLELDGAERSLYPRDDIRHARRLRLVDQDRHAV